MPTFDTPDRSRPRSMSPWATSGSAPATARTPSSTCARATRPTTRTSRRAELTRVEYANGQLLVKGPKLRSWLSEGRRVDRRDDRVAGRLARARHRGDGGLPLRRPARRLPHQDGPRSHPGRAAPTRCNLKSGIGDISVEHATGHAEVTTGSGDVRVRELDGGAVIKNSNGDTWVGWPAATCGSRRPTAASPSIGAREASSPSRPTATSGWARSSAARCARDPARRPRGRHPRGHGRLARRRPGAGRSTTRSSPRARPSAATVEVRARTTVGDIVIVVLRNVSEPRSQLSSLGSSRSAR